MNVCCNLLFLVPHVVNDNESWNHSERGLSEHSILSHELIFQNQCIMDSGKMVGEEIDFKAWTTQMCEGNVAASVCSFTLCDLGIV
jgi:hypothetical protein